MSDLEALGLRFFDACRELTVRYQAGCRAVPDRPLYPAAPPSLEDARRLIDEWRADRASEGEHPGAFGIERGDALASIFRAVASYITMERQAAYLLYAMIKDRPLEDGNTRIGALLLFHLMHQQRGSVWDSPHPLDEGEWSALVLLVARSDPTQKDEIMDFIEHVLIDMYAPHYEAQGFRTLTPAAS